MPEPRDNPNPRLVVDPPAILRHVMRRMFDPVVNPAKIGARRAKAEAQRQKAGKPHVVEYFHQLDDPYSHLAVQVLERFAANYEVEIVPHLIKASGGDNQPEAERLARWARRDAGLIAPHLGLSFPSDAGVRPDHGELQHAMRRLAGLQGAELLAALPEVSTALWQGQSIDPKNCTETEAVERLERGNARLQSLGHYSGAMFFYEGEWYWGVDRLFHLERRLRELAACRDETLPLIAPRPEIDVSGVDASSLELDFYPSLNSPYTSIIYDKTLTVAAECGIVLNHKPVLPMIMRGIPATKAKGMYIMFDTRREGEELGVSFGPVMTPIGEPVRQLYSLLPWARKQGRDTNLLSAALRLAFTQGVALHRKSGLRRAVENAGLDWAAAQVHLGSDDWKADVIASQNELKQELDFWGVPCFRLRGGDGFDDLCVWGQDRLWLIAAEIRKRAST